MIRDRQAGQIDIPDSFVDEEPWNWPQEITSRATYALEIKEEIVEDKGEKCALLSVIDQGIGMSLTDVQEYFLQVGKSFYRTTEFQREFTHTPISKFGIGFLSCLAVADHIEVTTRSRDESVGLTLNIQPPSNFFVIAPDATAEFGTTVRLRIRPSVVASLTQRHMPYGGVDILTTSEGNLTAMCLGWGIFIEFSVKTNSGPVLPRRPLTFEPEVLTGNGSRDSVGIRVASKAGIELAVGRAFYLISGQNCLPYFQSTTPNNVVLASVRGMNLSCDAFCTAREQIQIILDFRRIPPDAFTAGRSISWRNRFVSFVGDQISAHLHLHSHNEMKKQSSELAIIWKMFEDRSMSRSTHADLLPVRRREGQVEWLSWEAIEQTFDRIVIVPFHIGWKGPWGLDVPCVGVPNQQIVGLGQDVHTGATPVADCDLVQISDCCTGYLWPVGGKCCDLTLLSHPASYLHDSLRKWPTSGVRKTLKASYPIARELVEDEDLPEYDRRRCFWELHGVYDYAHPDDGTLTSKAAKSLLNSELPLTICNEILVIDVEGADNWQ